MSGAISVWSCQHWRAVRCGPLRTVLGSLGSGWSQRELSGSHVMGDDSETKGGDGDGGEKFGTERKRTWSRTWESHLKAFESTGTGNRVRFWTAVVHVLSQTESVLRRTVCYIYVLPDGATPSFPRRTPSTEPSNINIPSPNRSSEPPLVLGVLRWSKSPHTGHYSSRKGFRVRNLDTATMASLFFCCLAHWESKTALSRLLSAFLVCLDKHREKREGKRASTLIWRHVLDTNILTWESNQEVSAEG